MLIRGQAGGESSGPSLPHQPKENVLHNAREPIRKLGCFHLLFVFFRQKLTEETWEGSYTGFTAET